MTDQQTAVQRVEAEAEALGRRLAEAHDEMLPIERIAQGYRENERREQERQEESEDR